MRNSIWHLYSFIYKNAINLIINRTSTDRAVSLLIDYNSSIGNISFIRNVRKLALKSNNKQLNQNFNDVLFKNPIGLSAGFDKNAKMLPMLSSTDFGFITVGSITAKSGMGNPKPWYYRLPSTKSLIVNAGLYNEGSKAVLKRIRRYDPKIFNNIPIILSIAKTNCKEVISLESGINDYVSTIIIAKKEKVIKIIELNISCPNTYGGEPFTSPYNLNQLLNAIDKLNLEQSIFIKMPVDLPWEQTKELLDVASKHQVSGVTIANLTKDRTSINANETPTENTKGHLSGRPTWDKSNDLILNTYRHYGKRLTIIGVGGIFSSEDAYKKIKLGASMVELATGIILDGPQLPSKINYGLSKLLSQDGYDNISQAIGVDAIMKIQNDE